MNPQAFPTDCSRSHNHLPQGLQTRLNTYNLPNINTYFYKEEVSVESLGGEDNAFEKIHLPKAWHIMLFKFIATILLK